MIAIALLGLALGGLLGQQFAVFILWPAIAAAAVFIVTIGLLADLAASSQFEILVWLATSLQFGYLAGSFAKAGFGRGDRGLIGPASA